MAYLMLPTYSEASVRQFTHPYLAIQSSQFTGTDPLSGKEPEPSTVPHGPTVLHVIMSRNTLRMLRYGARGGLRSITTALLSNGRLPGRA